MPDERTRDHQETRDMLTQAIHPKSDVPAESVGDGSEYTNNMWALHQSHRPSITPDDHQILAYRSAPKAYRPLTFRQMELVHAVFGLVSELGEIVDPIKKHLIYGKPLDAANLVEEAGDLDWYAGLLLTSINHLRSIAMENNIAKLKRRYPEGYSDVDALARADKAQAAQPAPPERAKASEPRCEFCNKPLVTNTFDVVAQRPSTYYCYDCRAYYDNTDDGVVFSGRSVRADNG